MSAPYCTSLPLAPALGTDGLLHWSNGDWACDSGPITNYISHVYTDDGTNLCGAVPAFRYDGTKPLGAPGLDTWQLVATARVGQLATLDLYAVTHSVYSGVYDWWEVGNRMGADPTKTASVRFQIPTAAPPPPVQPNIPAAHADVTEAVHALANSYAFAHTSAASYAAVHQAYALLLGALLFLEGKPPRLRRRPSR